jgi:hypothetical protein
MFMRVMLMRVLRLRRVVLIRLMRVVLQAAQLIDQGAGVYKAEAMYPSYGAKLVLIDGLKDTYASLPQSTSVCLSLSLFRSVQMSHGLFVKGSSHGEEYCGCAGTPSTVGGRRHWWSR